MVRDSEPMANDCAVAVRDFTVEKVRVPKELETAEAVNCPTPTRIIEREPADMEAPDAVSVCPVRGGMDNARLPEEAEAALPDSTNTRRRVNDPEEVEAPEPESDNPALTDSIENVPGEVSNPLVHPVKNATWRLFTGKRFVETVVLNKFVQDAPVWETSQ